MRCRLVMCWLLVAACSSGGAQSAPSSSAPPATGSPPSVLGREFFTAIRQGDAKKFLSYIPEQGVDVGPRAEHVSRAEVEQQLARHRGLYCKLFDSSCIQSPIKLDNSLRPCSYRELLTHSEKVRTAATEAVRGGVRQAILVAEVKNEQCSGLGLIDFIFNEGHSGWELFSRRKHRAVILSGALAWVFRPAKRGRASAKSKDLHFENLLHALRGGENAGPSTRARPTRSGSGKKGGRSLGMTILIFAHGGLQPHRQSGQDLRLLLRSG